MDKKKLLYGVLGLLVGLAVGYWAADSLNRNYTNATNTVSDNPVASSELPPNHPPTDSRGGQGANPAGAQADVTAVIQQARNEPANFEAQMKAGSLFTQIKRYDQALEFYQRAYQVKKDDYDVLVALGNSNFDLQRFPEAERWYKEALKRKPEDVNVRTDLGLSYFLRAPKEVEKAIAEYRTSLGYDPRHEQTLQNLITALLEKGDKAAVRPYLQQLEQVNPNNPALVQFRAQLN